MGLFGLFGKKRKRSEAPEHRDTDENLSTDNLAEYSGMRVEISTLEGQVLFIAKLMNIQENTAELYQYSETTFSEDPLSIVQIRIRGYDDKNEKAVYLEGTTMPMPEHVWKVENLTLIRLGNDRAFFRVDTNIDGTITSVGRTAAGEEPCRILNISVGGACIISNARYHKGDRLLLNVKLFEERDASLLFCKVLRVTEKDYLGFEYGCRFLEMNETEQNRITQIIFDLQHKKIPCKTEASEDTDSKTPDESEETEE